MLISMSVCAVLVLMVAVQIKYEGRQRRLHQFFNGIHYGD